MEFLDLGLRKLGKPLLSDLNACAEERLSWSLSSSDWRAVCIEGNWGAAESARLVLFRFPSSSISEVCELRGSSCPSLESRTWGGANGATRGFCSVPDLWCVVRSVETGFDVS